MNLRTSLDVFENSQESNYGSFVFQQVAWYRLHLTRLQATFTVESSLFLVQSTFQWNTGPFLRKTWFVSPYVAVVCRKPTCNTPVRLTAIPLTLFFPPLQCLDFY